MKTQNLDEATRNELNGLTDEEVSNSVSWAYNHEILNYGISAVVHNHLMEKAQDVSSGELSREEFVEKYGLEFGAPRFGQSNFLVPLEKIRSDGIFIPQQRGGKVRLFCKDYNNRIMHNSWINKESARQLTSITWDSSDLEDSELVEQGIKFGRNMWRTCVEGFNKFKNGIPESDRNGIHTYKTPAQPQKVTDLSEKLIKYYSELVSEPITSK